MRAWVRQWSIARRLFVLQFVFIVVLSAVAVVLLWADSRAGVEADAASHSLVVATGVADNPFVVDAVTGSDPSATLEPYALALMRDTSTDFITIMAPDRTRFTHPNPAEIGKPFQGTIAPALAGTAFTETYAGTLGPSVRAVVPIRDASGQVVALVAAGVTVSNVSTAVLARLPIVFGVAVATLLVGGLLSWLLSRYLARVTWGRGAEEMSRMFAYYEGVLHSVREGLVLVDPQGRLVLYNDQAAELLGLPAQRAGAMPVAVASLPIREPLRTLLAGGAQAVDEIHLTDDRVLVVNQESAVAADGTQRARIMGTVTTLRDRTELQQLTGELQSLRTLSDALRSQTHEFSNRLHTIVSLIELGRTPEALAFAAGEFSSGRRLADDMLATVDDPVVAALLLGKSSQAGERGLALTVTVAPDVGEIEVPANDLVTILGNLVDNAFDAAAFSLDDSAARRQTEPRVSVELFRTFGETDSMVLRVTDNGPGLPDPSRAFARGYSTKTDETRTGRGIGLALVDQTVRRLGGTITVEAVVPAVVGAGMPAGAGGAGAALGERMPAGGAPAGASGTVFTVRIPQ